MWGIGVNGSATTQKNKKGRALVARCAACAGMFSHSCTNSDAFRLLQETRNAKQREEMEQVRIDASAIEEAAEGEPPAGSSAATEGIPKALNICRRNDARSFGCPRSGSWRDCASSRNPSANSSKTAKHWLTGVSHVPEWVATKELCSVLEPLKIVTHKIQGGAEGLLSRAIYLAHDVGEMLREDAIKTIYWVSRKAQRNDSTPGTMVQLSNLSDVAYTAVKVIVE
ncbi:unnamed protein product [Ectocarpus sp. CCAP 1310/34]|nr:unnamed protein product [Ectocarpus sp. CCAP 1310/34]